MAYYTEELEQKTEDLYLEEDAYEQDLYEIALSFRSFAKAMTLFILEHGYTESEDDNNKKIAFVKAKFKDAGIEVPRSVKSWFEQSKRPKRNTAFLICFAFSLNVEQTNDFFRRIYLERSFDCHSIEEAVYFFCMNNGYRYQEAEKMLKQLQKQEFGKIPKEGEILYTETVGAYIKNCSKPEALITYMKEQEGQFSYNNATAARSIRYLWGKIAGEDGLAVREGILLEKENQALACSQEDSKITVTNEKSVWTIYLQMLGLDYYQVSHLAVFGERSLKAILKDNVLLSSLAEEYFPDRQSIDKILLGKHVANESVRKLLILLVFYVYWAKRSVKKNDLFYCAEYMDAERCKNEINTYLLDAGYPELYAGNPYDWIFLWAMKDEYPLFAFRYYIGEVFAASERW